MTASASPAPAAPGVAGVGAGPRPRRKTISRAPSPGARFFASKRAVDEDHLATVYRWNELRCIREFARLRWGSHIEMPCPHCGTIDEHLWTARLSNWRCVNTDCRMFFSPTTNTLLDSNKRTLRSIYVETYLWSCGSAGIPALTIRAMAGTVSYNTSFSHIQKLREGLVRGHNTGLIAGVVEIDGAHASGHDAAGRRGKPLAQQQPKTPEQAAVKAQSVVDAFNARQRRKMGPKPRASGEPPPAPIATPESGVVRDPNTGAALPHNRRMVVILRRRTGNPGDGSLWTKVGVGLAETTDVVEYLAERHVLIPESVLATDEGVAFKRLGKQFRLHTTVNHSETLVGASGQHVNMAESFNARQDRAEAGIYLNIEPKYLHDYACETAFREDHRRLPGSVKTAKLLYWALSVGKSHFWLNYTAGKHRQFEELVPVRRVVGASSGPKKKVLGREMEGRPPR